MGLSIEDSFKLAFQSQNWDLTNKYHIQALKSKTLKIFTISSELDEPEEPKRNKKIDWDR